MKRPSAAHQARSVARLAAVQALYQMETAGAGVEGVIREFVEHRFDGDMEEGQTLAPADIDYFTDIVRGVVERQAEIDKTIIAHLAVNWRLERLDATARAILRSGAFELIARPEAPTEVVINEYVEVAKAFFEGPEPGFINGALDAIARHERA